MNNREPDELVIDAIRRVPGPVPSAALTAAVRAKASAAVRKRGLPTWINIAAALVLVVGAASWLRVAERVPEAMAPPASLPAPAAPGTAPAAPEAISSEVIPAQRARVSGGTGEPVSANTAATPPSVQPVDPRRADGSVSAAASRAQSDVSVPPDMLDPDLQGAAEAVAKSLQGASDKTDIGAARLEDDGAGLDEEKRATAAQEMTPGREPAVAGAQEPFVLDRAPAPAPTAPAARPAPLADAPAMAAPEPASAPAPGLSAQTAPPPPPPSMSAPSSAELDLSPAPAPLSAPEPQPQAFREQLPPSAAPRDEARKPDATTDPRFAQLRTALATGEIERVEALLQALKREVPRAQWPADLADRYWPL